MSAVSAYHFPAVGGSGIQEYQARPEHGVMSEPQKRLLSWQFAVLAQGKHSFPGADRAVIAKRRRKNKAARAARKAGRS